MPVKCPLCKVGKHSASCCPLSDAGRIDEPLRRKYQVGKAHWARDWQVYESLGLTVRRDPLDATQR